jgi:hypothetical protein
MLFGTVVVERTEFMTMPLLVFGVIEKSVCDEEPIVKAGAPLRRLFGLIERRPHGVEEPIPRKPEEVIVVVPAPPIEVVPYTETLFLNSALPLVSRMLPVVEVAFVPSKRTFVVSVV